MTPGTREGAAERSGAEASVALVSKQCFREAMANLCAAVTLVTTDGKAGRGGFTASAVCSVTDEPPTLLVCMNRSGRQAPLFRENGVLCVNLLSRGHQDISATFAGRGDVSIDQRFAEVEHTIGSSGSPVLGASVVSFDCAIDRVVTAGTHDVLFCHVREISFGAGENALVYFRRAYHLV